MKVIIEKAPVAKKAYKKGGFLNSFPYPALFGINPYGVMNSNKTGTQDDDITSTLKPVDDEDANIEAEKGEVLVKPGLVGMYKVTGKKHSQGGTPLYAEGGSFIFSDDPNLALHKDDQKEFKFKKSYSNKDKANTPAKVVQREVPAKDYNSLLSILQDPTKDKTAKDTAGMMLSKYMAKLGQVAYLQELKKNLPDGVPDFAAGPPQENPQIAGQTDEQEMYATGGGVPNVNIKGLPKSLLDMYNNIQPPAPIDPYAEEDNTYMQGTNLLSSGPSGRFNTMQDFNNTGPQSNKLFAPAGDPFVPKADSTIPWQGYHFRMNAPEMLETASPFLTALSQKQYFDPLIQKHENNVRFDRVDNQQELANIQQQASLGTREAFQNSPGNQASAIAASIRANAVGQSAASNANIRQQNTQIGNQELAQNTSRQDEANMFNLGQVQQTGRNNMLTQQRRGYELANAGNQSLSTGLAIDKSLKDLAAQATAMATPFLTTQKDAQGNPVFARGPNGQRVSIQGVPFQFNDQRTPIFTPGFGDLDSIGVRMQGTGQQAYEVNNNLLQYIDKQIQAGTLSPQDAVRAAYILNRPNTKGFSSIGNILQTLRTGTQ